MKNRNLQFNETLVRTQETYTEYVSKLTMLCQARYKYVGMPETVNIEFLEECLCEGTPMAFFMDEVMGLLCLRFIATSWDVYGKPSNIRVYGRNGYQRELKRGEYALIKPNRGAPCSVMNICRNAAKLLTGLDRMIEVNVRAQKTPVMIRCDESQLLTAKNLYKQYDGNEPVIMTNKSLGTQIIDCVKTDAPYHAEELYTLKQHYWNECMTALGIASSMFNKKERMLRSEVTQEEGGTHANRMAQWEARTAGLEDVKKLWGICITCELALVSDKDEFLDGGSEDDAGNEYTGGEG